MAERLPSWEKVARRLALRLYNHAFCSLHPESDPGEECPACDDRAVYRLWQKKAGIDPKPRELPGQMVDVFEWMRRDSANKD